MLVVDDQHGVCVSLSYLLETAGYVVRTAASGRAAIALAENETIDGALIDVHMPVMNGFDTCIALQRRTRPLGRPMRVWFMTGAFTSVLQRRCTEVGGLGVFSKPFEFSDLLARIEQGLSSSVPASPPLPSLSCAVAGTGDGSTCDGGTP